MMDKVTDTPDPGLNAAKPTRSSTSSKAEGLRRTKSKSYKNVFKGSVLVSTLLDHDSVRFGSRAAAVQFAQRLLDAGHIESIVGAADFEDSVHLFRWSDESVVREAKKMVSTLSSHIPRKKLIELVDLHKAEGGEEAFVMKDVKERLHERSARPARTPINKSTRSRRRQTLDSSQLTENQEPGARTALSSSVSSENLATALEIPNPLRTSSVTSSNELLASPRRGSNQSISDSCQTDTEKVRSPDRVRSPLRSPVRSCSPDSNAETLESNETPGPSVSRTSESDVATGNINDEGTRRSTRESESDVFTNDENIPPSTVRYDGIDMPALDLENLDFDSVRSLSNAADALSVLDPSLESLSEQGNCYSDNEKHLLEQMRKMQQEHAHVVTSYEERINELMAKMTDLRGLAEILQNKKQEDQTAADANNNKQAAPPISSPIAPPPATSLGGSRLPPAPPPPPPMGMVPLRLIKPSKPPIKPRVKMRPLFWNRIIQDNTNAKTPRDHTFWGAATEPNFDVDEFERLFGKNVEEDSRSRSLHEAMAKGRAAKIQSAKVLDENRSRMVAIRLRSLHCQMVDIQAALYNMDFSTIDIDSLFCLYEIRGSKEELDKINTQLQADEDTVLDQPEQFIWELAHMSHFPERVECLMLRKRFNETLFDIDQQLNSVRTACQELWANDHLRLILEMVLAFGNYMNGGTQRGQADGYDLSILPKLKDVKSMDNHLNLLHYIVRVCTREFEEDAGRNEAVFRLPDPASMSQASQVSFVDLDADLNSLGHQLATHAKKAELVCLDTETELIQPFKDQMDDFFDSAEAMLQGQQSKLEEARTGFHALLRYLSVKDVTEQVVPETFFGMFYRFIEDYRQYWIIEQKRIAKQMFEKVEQKRKARLRSAKRRKSELDSGKSHLKQKFEQMRRRSENLPAGKSQPTVKLLRSQSATGELDSSVVEDGGPRSAPLYAEERPRRRRRQQSENLDGPSETPHSETMAQRMQRRRRTRLSGDDTADSRSSSVARGRTHSEDFTRSRTQSEDLGRQRDPVARVRKQEEAPEEGHIQRRRARASSATTEPPKPEGEVLGQRRRRMGRQELSQETEVSRRTERDEGTRESRVRGSAAPANAAPDTGQNHARELMKRFADRGQQSVRKADIFNKN